MTDPLTARAVVVAAAAHKTVGASVFLQHSAEKLFNNANYV